MYGRQGRCVQGFGGETRSKETTLKAHRWEDNIKMDLERSGMGKQGVD